MRRHFATLTAFAVLAGCGYLLPAGHQSTEPEALRPGAYRLDPDHSTILWKVDHFGYSTFVGRFDRLNASLDFSAEDPTSAVLDVRIDTTSVSTHVEGFDETLRGDTWFAAEAFPEARFSSREIEVTGPDTGRVTGELELKGERHPVVLDVTFNGGATNMVTGRYTLGFAASMVIDRTEFGITSLAPAIGREVALEIHAEFIAVDNATEADTGSTMVRAGTTLASPARLLTSAMTSKEDTK